MIKLAYVTPNFKTKKALKEAVARGEEVEIFEPGPMGQITDGANSVEGPHYPEPHRWYAQVNVENGLVNKVIS